MKVDGKKARVTRKGTCVYVRTEEDPDRVWWLNTPDAAELADELADDAQVSAKELEARGFLALK